jgi:hypothetical protein
MTLTSSAKFGTGAKRRREQGQTILLVAISIVSLLAMAALAIDVVTLYVASTEIQRAADAAALVGAKAMVDSGVTTLQPSDGDVVQGETLAQDMAISAVSAVVQAAVNKVAGGSPVLVGGVPTFSWAEGNGNPHITVTLQQANLPTFFAKVWGSKSAIASASATAEAYNPANQNPFTPIQTSCVKPWLIGNSDPNNGGTPFVARTTGLVETPATSILGKQFWLSSDCKGNGDDCTALIVDPPGNSNFNGSNFDYFVPAAVVSPPPSGADICPSSTASPCGVGNDPADKAAIECCHVTPYTCGGNLSNPPNRTTTLNPGFPGDATSDLALGTECLIHASAEQAGQGQDSLDWTTAPFPNGPPQITAGSGPKKNSFVSTSSSIVTIPILDTQPLVTLPNTPPYPVVVVGFLQAFVNSVDDLEPGGTRGHHGDVNITVLNVIGCSQTPNGNAPAIGGNGASPIPVRLITPP